MSQQQSLWGKPHFSNAVPPSTLVLWPPGVVYRTGCGCLLRVNGTSRRVIACAPQCETAAALRRSLPLPEVNHA